MKSSLLVFIMLSLFFSCSKEKSINGLGFKNLNKKSININVNEYDATIFYFLAPECPLSQNYTKEINELNEKYKDRGVRSFAVFSGNIYSDEEMNNYVSEYDIQIEGLKDDNYFLAKHFGATITPEVFLINSSEEVIYSGKIDNWIESLGVKRQVVTKFYLLDALKNLLNNEEVLIKKTEAVGCVLE